MGLDCDVCGDIEYEECRDCNARLCEKHWLKGNHYSKCEVMK